MSDEEGASLTEDVEIYREPLIQRRAAITRRFDALFKAMSTDFLLREQFVTDPAQITSEYVYSTRMPPRRASIINQLLYSVFSNGSLLRFLRDYSISHRQHPPSRHEFIRDFVRAVVEHGGQHVVLALIRSSIENERVLIDDALLHVIFGGAGIFGGDGTDTGTGTDSTGTDSTGTGTDTTGTGTDSTGTGTDTTGTGTDTTGTGTGTDTTGTGTGTGTDTGTGTGTGTDTGTGTGTGTDTGTGTGTDVTGGTFTGTGTFTGITLSTFITDITGTGTSTGGTFTNPFTGPTGGGTPESMDRHQHRQISRYELRGRDARSPSAICHPARGSWRAQHYWDEVR